MENDLIEMLKKGPETYAQKLKKMSEKLFSNLSLNAFSWTIIYKTGFAFTLCTNPDHYQRYYLDAHFKNDPCFYDIHNLNHINVWGMILDCKNYEQYKVQQQQISSNMFNGLCLKYLGSNYFETFDFATSIKDKSIVNFLISHLDQLNQFINNFKLISNHYLDKNKDFLVNVNSYLKDFNISNNINNTISNTQNPYVDKITIDTSKWRFTSREKEILHFLFLNYTNREIGEILFLSRRTVETHVNNIKIKLGCKRKSNIIRLLAE